MPDIGGLIRGALGGGQQAAAEVLIQYRADTTELDKALARIEQQSARETQIAQDKAAKLRALQEQEAALQQKYEANRLELVRAQAMSTDAEVAAITRRREAIAAQIQQSQVSQANLKTEIDLLAAHRAQITADAAAMKERAASGTGPGVSAAGAAVLGGIGGVLALTGLQALQRGINDATRAWAEYGHAVSHASALMGTSTENASRLLYAFQFFGMSVADADRTIAQLTRHIADNEKQFSALGIQTRQANGELVDSYTVFNRLREVMSAGGDGATKLALQLQLASRGGSAAGSSMAELNQILGLSDAQWNELSAAAQRAGFILSRDAADGAFKFYNEMRATEMEQRALALGISQELAPTIETLTRWALTATVAIKQMGGAIAEVVGGAALGALVGGPLGALVGAVAGGGLAALTQHISSPEEIGAEVDRMLQAARDLAKLQDDATQNNAGALKSNLADAKRAETEAIRDQIDALREVAQAREDEMRAALKAYEREHEAAIQAIRDEEKAREDAHNDEIKRLQDEQRARDDALNDAEEQRRSTIEGLRQEVQAREQALQMEEAQYNLQQDEQSLAREKLDTTTVRGPRENIEDFYKRRYEAEQKLAKDTHKVLMDQKKIELDHFKSATDAQIHGIEALSKAAREANEKQKRDTEARIEAIRKEMELEKRKAEAQIAAIQKAMQAERDKVEAAIKNLQRETQEQVKELEKRLKALEAFGTGAGGAFTDIGNKAKDAADKVAELNAQLAAMTQIAELKQKKLVDQNDPPDVGGAGFNAGSHDTSTRWWKFVGELAANLGLSPNKDQILDPDTFHDYPHDFMLTEPTALIGRSGRSYGVAAASGPESIRFNGVGGAEGHGHTIVVNLDGRKVGEIIADRQMSSIASGYGLRQ